MSLAVSVFDSKSGKLAGKGTQQVRKAPVVASPPRPVSSRLFTWFDESELLYCPGLCVVDHVVLPRLVPYEIRARRRPCDTSDQVLKIKVEQGASLTIRSTRGPR